jgi:hypothetical protein
MRGLAVFCVIASLAGALPAAAQHGHVAAPPPVAGVGDVRLPVGGGALALYTSLDWTMPQPAVTRAVVIIHGEHRDADRYFATALAARALSGLDSATVAVVAPQFLATGDPGEADLLRWGWDNWSDGEDAKSPAPVSSYAALDAVLHRLGDRSLFPALRTLVLAGFSAGGQMVQRYAIVGREAASLQVAGVHVRYVVGSPSSYLYFSADRPGPTTACGHFDHWKYGLAGRLPPYVGPAPDAAALEHAYAAADVIYLLGGADTDPEHKALDRGCAAEAEGPTRLARGMAFTDYLRARDPAAAHQPRWVIPGVGHEARRVFASACGVAALFDTAGCALK